MLFTGKVFLDNETRTAFNLKIDFTDILSDDTYRSELNTEGKEDERGDGSERRDEIEDGEDEESNQSDSGESGEENTEGSNQLNGFNAERGNTVESESEHFFEGIF